MSPLSEAALLMAAIFAIWAVALVLLKKIRRFDKRDRVSAQELLNRFRDSHAHGQMTDAEFSAVRSKLAVQVQAEFNEGKEPG
jgi:hypothetical protein